MLNKFCLAISAAISGGWHRYYRRGLIVFAFLLLNLSVGCRQLQSPKLDMSIQVESLNRPGMYLVSGKTNLPENSTVEVSALRYFRPTAESSSPGINPPYSILSRQRTRVERGKWRVKLKLWQVASDGRFQEEWQLNTSKASKPTSEVTFLALVNPNRQSPKLREKLEQQADNFAERLIRFTSDGQWYVQAAESLPLSLPTGKTTPPPLRAENINSGWGDRSSIQRRFTSERRPPAPPAKTNQTNAPLSPSEMLK